MNIKYNFFIVLVLFISTLLLSCGTESTPIYTLTTSVTGEGTITPSSGEFEEGETVTLTSTPSTHWVFSNWSGDGSGSSSTVTITMDRDKNVVGNFIEREYTINYTINGSGDVEEEVIQPKGQYIVGTVVRLTPVPDTGWEFEEWSGWDGEVDEENRIVITVDGEVSVSVTFGRMDFPLTVSIEGEGEVEQEILSSPKTTDYPFETVVQLTSKPDDGWVFFGWGGELSGNGNPETIEVNEGKDVTSTFKSIDELLTIEISGQGTVKIQQKSFEDNPSRRSVTLTPTPKNGWSFVGWSGDVESTEEVIELTINKQTNITVVFNRINVIQTYTIAHSFGTTNVNNGDPYPGSLTGAGIQNNKFRIYYQQRIFDPQYPNYQPSIQIIETQSQDLDTESWYSLGEVTVSNNLISNGDEGLDHIFYHNGWKGIGPAVDNGSKGMYLYTSEDGIHFTAVKLAFSNWAMDTKFNSFFDPNKERYVIYGRVRGSQSKAAGGFGDTLNRRGISYHESNGSNWNTDNWSTGLVVADPKDFFDFNSSSPMSAPYSIIDSEGIERIGHGLIRYDFYIPNIYWDYTSNQYKSFTVVFFRHGNRIVDRSNTGRRSVLTTPFQDRDLVTQSRWRYVGPWYPISLISNDGINFSIENTDLIDGIYYPSPFGIAENYKRQIDLPPYITSGSNIKDRFTHIEEPPMIDAFPGVLEWNGDKFIVFTMIDRFYFQIPKTNINPKIVIKKIN
jgi:hypothetical protein